MSSNPVALRICTPPEDTEFMDIRRGTHVEFGQSIYEPFGIAQLEPLSFGALCVITNVCGCAGFVNAVTQGRGTPNVIVTDYTDLGGATPDIDELLRDGAGSPALRAVVCAVDGSSCISPSALALEAASARYRLSWRITA